MRCPYCTYLESKVVDSRSTEENTTIRRRRECLECGKRFTTYERIDELPIMVVKRNGGRERFDRNKLLNGLLKSCEKRPISRDQLEGIVNSVEQQIRNQMEDEIETTVIGELVMNYLSKLDEVAYVRFASVYRQFKDIETFRMELDKLLGE
ncbi:transcriptional repressor NrdR [Orenia metallireducens]|jgi:transcriptional repressor NrdR|uniref:Transcriptional repressor NrdR n=1 Tax=Orenia metallireducens TaxID=1413210 RepID=A0A285GVY8_9FIRM|nr:transcriptional regulator NrdR [Orenia metallireducens]PRX31092.1 transcriptional repressor NrdR [Orenia metallireducens]SNY27645.1 transcriptional repressor NrdR [Orenia metallireducens]